LRQAQWPLLLNALNALTPAQQASDRWQYWRARVNEELGETVTAMAYFTALAQRRSYYGFLSADRLGQPYALADRPHNISAGTLFEIGQQAAVLRAREFIQLGRMTQARREWYSATQGMNNDDRVDAAKLAQHWGWAAQSILTMASTDQRDDLALRFPLLFQQQVLDHSEREEINPAWTYGVIRRESAFVQDARSPKGAVGLMQLMPATAKYISRSLPKKYRGRAKLTQADTNLALGTHYLRRMLKRFSGQTVLATAAYNAGEHRIMRWLPEENTLDADRWIENIPFRETREYVTSVLAFTIIYADRLGFEPIRLSQQMAAVPARKTL
jgi:peptidoglycan lytic transglycosylase